MIHTALELHSGFRACENNSRGWGAVVADGGGRWGTLIHDRGVWSWSVILGTPPNMRHCWFQGGVGGTSSLVGSSGLFRGSWALLSSPVIQTLAPHPVYMLTHSLQYRSSVHKHLPVFHSVGSGNKRKELGWNMSAITFARISARHHPDYCWDEQERPWFWWQRLFWIWWCTVCP